ncbi:MAG TPA: hypothetical protein VN843_07870, partial [Anaerolineales bacterium]|nr:hypothetical protein [Anaerolineales bacterium]
ITLLILISTACAPAGQLTEEPSIPNDDITPTGIPMDLSPAQRAAITALSEKLNLTADKITVVSTEAVTWPDGCLGIVRMGVMCTQAEVPGFKIILEAEGNTYEVHTNQDGSVVVHAVGEQETGSVEEAVIKQLAANLGLNEGDISVVSNEIVEFSDSCLGITVQEVKCAQVTTPGRIIILEAKDVQYEYHTSENGTRIQPATLALSWKREGGIAGFCDRLIVFLSGEIYGSQCKSQPDGTTSTFAKLLSASEQRQFNTWITKFGEVHVDASDPKGVSDRMEVMLDFYGLGSSKPSDTVQQAIFTWVQDLFQKLYS